MADSVRSLPIEITDRITLQMRNCFTREGLDRKKELNVLVIPSITINEMLAFETQVPDEEELIEAMDEFLQDCDKNTN
ncbi:hypothetical protein [Dehalobacterium formicoaceticum]|uniref:Uncharacterized protein n=1 Tax=Dehalobacterium formicoaceticum TaxID=51515 RepID=A0ABT1Y399_9FIRM|nr:hypothetical protein [Dehalobacterium formicoaceticum]MCR6544966.1 hypothetical protein [Dehalobacterium formicoaceticum]